MFEELVKLEGQFWTVFDELLDDIRDCGFSIDEANDEYITCTNENEESYAIYLGGTGRTMYIFKIRKINF